MIGPQFSFIRHKYFGVNSHTISTINHAIDIEKAIINLIQKHYPDIKLLSISKNTNLNTLIPIALEINNTIYIPVEKHKDSLKDWLLLPSYDLGSIKDPKIFCLFKNILKNILIQKGLKNECRILLDNHIIRFIKDNIYTIFYYP